MNAEALIATLAGQGHFLLFDRDRVTTLCAAASVDTAIDDRIAASQQALLAWRERVEGAAPCAPPSVAAADPCRHPLHYDRSACRNGHAVGYRAGVLVQQWPPHADTADGDATSHLLALVVLLLSRWSGEALVGVDVARSERRAAAAPYFVVRRQQCRATVDAGAGFAALAAALPSCLSEDTANANESTAGRFQLAFAAYDSAELLPADLAALECGESGPHEGYDIALHVADLGHRPCLRWVFNETVFDRRTIEGLAVALTVLSDAVSADPARAVETLPLIVADPAPLAAGRTEPDAWLRVHRRFERQAAATPDRPALQFAGRALSYRQLNERANRLARWLIARRGVAAGSVVAVCVDRSPDMVVAVFAILKAGAAYLPLDPSHPRGRIARVLDDSGVTLALTRTAYRETLLPASLDAVGVDGADFAAELAPLSGDNLDPGDADAAADALAYVIYTSGSTGEPKGVCIEQASFGFFVAAMLQRLAPQGPRRWLALITLTFDMSLVDLFVSLCRGDLVVIAAASELADASALQILLHDNAVDALQATPTTWSLLVAAGWQGSDRLLAISGGEPLDRSLADALLARCGQLWNGYGPTEITVYSLFKRVARDEDALDQLSIGDALPQVSHYILDAQRRALPAGAVGELFIGGPGLARGYHGKPELTARQFVEQPFGAGSPRLYRSGDRVRLLPSGNLQYLGRLDAQIKLRGYRIEPGEIEYLLQRADGVEQAVVDVRTRQGSAALVAFVKWRAAAAGSAREGARRLRELLKAALPPYMVPDLFVSVEAFARTASGKLDRKALQLPADDAIRGEQPRNTLETALLATWQALFGRDDIGVTDNFFALGGSSLLLGRLMTAIRAELGYSVGFSALFEHDTVRQLGTYMQAQQPPPSPVVGMDGSEGDEWPLTPMQQHMWLTTQREPAAGSYNIPLFFEAQGVLDDVRLETALARLTRRFPALRASFFIAADGEVRQRLLAQRTVPLRRLDLSAMADDAQRQAALQALIDDEASRPFDLQHEPLLRATAVTLQPMRHCLLLSLHHIVGDERSLQLLVEELVRLCSEDAPLHRADADGATYRNYLARRTVVRDVAKERADLAYWETHLAGMPEIHRLPLDRPRAAVQSFNGALFEHDLDAALAARSQAFARQLRTTPFTVFHAALAALLSRLSGDKDILIGTPVSDRHKGAGEQEVGCFLNVVTLRSDLSADPSLSALVQASRHEVAAALQHDEVAMADLGRRLHLSNDTSHAAFFQVMLAQQTADYLRVQLDGLALRQFYPPRFAAKTDLIVNLCERDGATTLRWEYNADLWQADSIRRMAAQLLVLLDAGLREPQRPLSRLPLASGGVQASDSGLAGPAVDFGPFRFVHERFQAQAALTPDATALRYRDQTLSYAQLDRRADRLARHLIAQQLGESAVVAICLPRGIAMVVAVLAAMKAGLTYLPLDPTHPAQRLQQVLADAGAALVVTDRAALPALPEDGVPLLCLEPSAEDDAWPAAPDQSPVATQRPERDAYIIYTSGSTGTPKGVCISHAALAHFLSALSLQLPSPPRRWLAVITLAFDMSIVDLWLPLLRGDCVVIAGDEDIVDGQRLGTLIEAERITALQATPSTWQLLLSAGWNGRADLLAISGGEALSEPLARALLSRCEQLWNGYGPTEITVYSLLRQVHDSADVAALLSLGGPLANTRHYVLDEHLTSVPPGVAGQLYIGGPGLARQYFGQPALTAERFVERPADGGNVERLYRTGDLVCRMGAERLQFLGRCDNQVKIRGYRIELGEIEQALLDEDGVEQAVVDVKSWGDNAVLAAFVILDGAGSDADTCIARLRKRLAQRLPRYMVPQILVDRAAFPRTPNGKVDRKALLRGVVREQTPVEPVGDTEQQLARLWAEILALDAVGATSSFFALGGQSILITKMLYLIRKTFGVELQVGWIYENPTVRGMAEKIDTAIALKHSELAFGHVAGLNEVEL